MPLELELAWNWPVGGVMLAVLTESTPQHHSTTMTRRCGWQPRVLVNKAEFPLVPDFCGKKTHTRVASMRGSKSHHSGAILQRKKPVRWFSFPLLSILFHFPFPPPQTTALWMTSGDDVPNTDHARLPGQRVSRVVGRVPESLCIGSGPRPSVSLPDSCPTLHPSRRPVMRMV